MSLVYKILQRPAKWVSAHRKNEFKLRLPQTTISSGYDDGDGYLKLNLAGAFPLTLAEGDRIYIPPGTDYTGFHKVKTIHSSIQITLNTTYTSSISGSVVIRQVYLPTISIYKGYKQGELVVTYDSGTVDLYDILPYTLVAEFQPEVGLDGNVTLDICGYLKTVIEAPYKPAYNADEDDYIYPQYVINTFCPKYYNKVTVLVEDRWNIATLYAANAAISTDELNRDFVDTGRQMQPLLQPVNYFGDFQLGDYILGNFIYAKLT